MQRSRQNKRMRRLKKGLIPSFWSAIEEKKRKTATRLPSSVRLRSAFDSLPISRLLLRSPFIRFDSNFIQRNMKIRSRLALPFSSPSSLRRRPAQRKNENKGSKSTSVPFDCARLLTPPFSSSVRHRRASKTKHAQQGSLTLR